MAKALDVKTTPAWSWVEVLARFGLIAKGVIYMLVGLLTVQAALGARGSLTSKVGALQILVAQPLGTLVIAVLTAGLGAYILWRFVQAILDPANECQNIEGLPKRLGYAANGLLYIALAYAGLEILTGSPIQESDEAAEDWTALLLSWPLGVWLVGGVGVAIVGYALYSLYRVYQATFCEPLDTDAMSEETETWVVAVGRVGLLARSVIYGVIGVFLVQAALRRNPEQAAGLRDALDALAQAPFGLWLLAIMGVGLMAYGVYQLVQARYRYLSDA
jgi:hypothetical protein